MRRKVFIEKFLLTHFHNEPGTLMHAVGNLYFIGFSLISADGFIKALYVLLNTMMMLSQFHNYNGLFKGHFHPVFTGNGCFI